MSTTPRTDAACIQCDGKGWYSDGDPERPYHQQCQACNGTGIAETYQGELAAITARAEKAEAELAEAKTEIENLVWNLAGCSTIAQSGKPTDYSHELARPALHDVNKLAARAEKAEERLKWLERFLQAGGTSINTASYYTVENHPDDTDETHFNFPFQIGISVETEDRGCYEWVEFSNGAKGICPAIDAAKIKYSEWRNQIHKGD